MPVELSSSIADTGSTSIMPGFGCDSCNKISSAIDTRYSSEVCSDYDLCQSCFDRSPICSVDESHLVKKVSSTDWELQGLMRRRYSSLLYSKYSVDKSRHQIRLLHVHKAEDDDAPVEACIQVRSLDDWPSHHALSYCWGEDTYVRRIYINSAPYTTTQTVETALKRIRCIQERKEFLIWVDAICIDQSDDVERGSQVEIMRTIYGRASKVYVYLGEHEREDALDRDEQQLIFSRTRRLCGLRTNAEPYSTTSSVARGSSVLGSFKKAPST